MAQRLQILVIGPRQVGKTGLSNILGELSDSLSPEDTRPTSGVRILEVERNIVNNSEKRSSIKWKDATVAVELWDCSGDAEYFPCWRDFRPDGVIFVIPPDAKYEKELVNYQELFQASELSPTHQMVVFAHNFNPSVSTKGSKFKLTSKPFSKVPVALTSVEEPDAIRSEFDRFLANVYTKKTETDLKEEAAILN